MDRRITLSAQAEARLAVLAYKAGKTKYSYLREIIERGLEDAEDYYIAAEVLKGVREGSVRVYSSAEVREYLGMDDAI